MNLWVRIWKTLELLMGTVIAISRELIQYYLSPYALLRIMELLPGLNRRIRQVWVTKRGRKPLSDETRTLIIELKTLNPRWGGQRISDELKKVGIYVSKKTVLKVLREEGLGALPPHHGLRWSEVLKNQGFVIGIDFTCVISLFGKQFFIFVILDLKTRVLLNLNATLHPTREWVSQQFRNAFLDLDVEPSLCVSDNDGIFGQWLDSFLSHSFQMGLIKIPYRKPWYNGRVERFHRSLKFEALPFLIPLSPSHLHICREFALRTWNITTATAVTKRSKERFPNIPTKKG